MYSTNIKIGKIISVQLDKFSQSKYTYMISFLVQLTIIGCCWIGVIILLLFIFLSEHSH